MACATETLCMAVSNQAAVSGSEDGEVALWPLGRASCACHSCFCKDRSENERCQLQLKPQRQLRCCSLLLATELTPHTCC